MNVISLVGTVTTLVAASVPSIATAQQPRREPAPRPTQLAIAGITMPPVTAFTLDNGLRVLAVRDETAPIFEARLVIDAGWRDEQHAGTSLLLREMVLTGASGTMAMQTVQRLDSLGILFTGAAAGTDAEGRTTTFRMSGPSPSLAAALRLLSNAVITPGVDSATLNARRQRFIEGRRARLGDAAALAGDRVLRLTREPASRDHADPGDSILARVTTEQLRSFHTAHYAPGKAILVVVSPRRDGDVLELASERFGTWRGAGAMPGPAHRAGTDVTSGRVASVERSASTQATIAVGAKVGGQASADHAQVLLLRYLVTRMLNEDLRASRGWTYGVNVLGTHGDSTGTLVITTSVHPMRAGDAMTAIMQNLASLRDQPRDSAEVDLVLRVVAGGLARAAESRETVAERAAATALLRLPGNYWTELQRSLVQTGPRELQGVAQRYLTPERLYVVAVGDSSQVRAMISRLDR